MSQDYPTSPATPPTKPGIWWRITHLEPVVYRAVVMAVFGVLAGTGITVSETVPDSTAVLVLAVLAIIQGVWTRGSVMPNDKVVVYAPAPAASPNAVCPGPASTDAQDAEILRAARTEGSV